MRRSRQLTPSPNRDGTDPESDDGDERDEGSEVLCVVRTCSSQEALYFLNISTHSYILLSSTSSLAYSRS